MIQLGVAPQQVDESARACEHSGIKTVSLNQTFDLGFVAVVCAIREPTYSIIDLFDSKRQAVPGAILCPNVAGTGQTKSEIRISVDRGGAGNANLGGTPACGAERPFTHNGISFPIQCSYKWSQSAN